MKTIKLAVVEDIDGIRLGLEEYFNSKKEFSEVHVFSNMEDIIQSIREGYEPDVVLSDIGLPGMSGIEGIGIIAQLSPNTDIIMLTVFMDGDKIFKALCSGATGYLLKETPMPEIKKAILQIREGGSYMSPSIARKVIEHFKTPTPKLTVQLTEKERNVIDCLLDGLSYKLIADRLQISIDTVRFRIKSIYRKLHVNSKAEVLSKVLRGDL